MHQHQISLFDQLDVVFDEMQLARMPKQLEIQTK